ncbi:PGC-1 and ERR-induced regulator in muscle protein 1 [Xyrauchen texanus]|uniref:PGC-1 and ERR-induced regulator in muscle protein 1 n=1 Tax=Xyrauchen texanus TaxID=154827 RepID=UPI00224277F9|nr:PGC-1 and ERR-induced regulator in muscle protein 1 [Xyrauchen texanus]XP_051947240.1 PGC-1 and ERR-induced regulator in muscle protein 1 [Xyrauchen texanus]
MEDFEYSVHISEQDWNSFFQECEDCNLFSPVLASREDSGMSDIDELGCHILESTSHPDAASTEPDLDLQIDGPPEGSPVDDYLNKYGICSSGQVLSGSEEDLDLQTVNVFFEKLRCATVDEQPLEQSQLVNWVSEKMDHLEGLIDKQDMLSVDVCPSGKNEAKLKGEITKQGEANTWGNVALEKAVAPTSANAQVNAPTFSDRELVTGEESLSLPLITVGLKQEQEGRCGDLIKELKLKPEAQPPEKGEMPPMVVVNMIDMTDQIPARENIAHLDSGSSSDSKDSPVSQFPVSPSNLRRKRRKKRMSIQPVELGHGYEAQFQVHRRESEEEKNFQGEEINNLPLNVTKSERLSFKRIKTHSTHTADNVRANLLLSSTFALKASADLKSSKSLPVSFTTSNLGIEHTSTYDISKSMSDLSLSNHGKLKTKVCDLSSLPKTDKVLNSQESDIELNITEALPSGPAIHRETNCLPTWNRTGIRKTLSEPLSDNSEAGCRRKSLLSPNISSAADSKETPSPLVLSDLIAYKDLSCLRNEIDCSIFKNEQHLLSIMAGISDIKQSSFFLTSSKCSDENSPKTFTCSQDTQDITLKSKAFTQIDALESQSQSTAEIHMIFPNTDCHMPDNSVISDDGKDGAHFQSRNKQSSKILIVDAQPIRPRNITDDSDGKGDMSVNEFDKSCHAVADRIEGYHLLCGIQSEYISGNEIKEESKLLSEDGTQNTLADVSELPQNIAADMQETSTYCLDLNSEAKYPESVVLDTADQIPFPVYAISSFWNEMEKLTINDILRLRLIGNAQYPNVLTQPEDGSIVDTTDAADSGYFTQPDDSKHMSFISDLDEDIAQLQTQISLKQEDESCQFPSSCSVTWENDPDPVVMGEDIVLPSSKTTLPEPVFSVNAQQCFRKMCKNVSVQNLQALEAQPIRRMLRNASLHSIHSEVEDNLMDPFYHVDTTLPMCQSDDEEMESSGVTFSEIIQYYFGADEPERCASCADNIAASHLDGTGTSVAEMYDHFFSDFDTENFYPLAEESGGNKDNRVPVFSSSTKRTLEFPDAYDYFFTDSPCSDEDENDNSLNKEVTWYDHKSSNHDPVPESFLNPLVEESVGIKDKMVPIFSYSRSANRNLVFPEAYDYFFPDSPGHSDEDDENDNSVIKVVTRYDHKSSRHDPVAPPDMYEHFYSEENFQNNFLWTNPLSFRRVRRTGFTVPEDNSCSWALSPVKPFPKGIQPINVSGLENKPFPDPLLLSIENCIYQQLAEQQKQCIEMQTAVADPRLDAPFLPLKQADMCLVCIAFASWVLKSTSSGTDAWKAALLANISALSAIRYLRRHKREEVSGKTPLRQIEPA